MTHGGIFHLISASRNCLGKALCSHSGTWQRMSDWSGANSWWRHYHLLLWWIYHHRMWSEAVLVTKIIICTGWQTSALSHHEDLVEVVQCLWRLRVNNIIKMTLNDVMRRAVSPSYQWPMWKIYIKIYTNNTFTFYGKYSSHLFSQTKNQHIWLPGEYKLPFGIAAWLNGLRTQWWTGDLSRAYAWLFGDCCERLQDPWAWLTDG